MGVKYGVTIMTKVARVNVTLCVGNRDSMRISASGLEMCKSAKEDPNVISLLSAHMNLLTQMRT